jgi:hypothetical protein
MWPLGTATFTAARVSARRRRIGYRGNPNIDPVLAEYVAYDRERRHRTLAATLAA